MPQGSRTVGNWAVVGAVLIGGVVVTAVGAGATSSFSSAAAASAPAQAQPAVNPQAATIDAFRKRLDAYIAQRDKASSSVPPLKETTEPGAITAYERAVSAAIIGVRKGAKPGDLFGTDMGRLIRAVVQEDWQTRSREDRAALRGAIPKPFVPRVNMTYPSGYPLATFPPALLRALQPLPDDLEYRFVGRALILRDVKANLIVDVMRDVLPAGS